MEIDGCFRQLGIAFVKDVPSSGMIKAITTSQYPSNAM